LATLLDTDVAIHLREGDPWVEEQVRRLRAPLQISAITRIELESGVYRELDLAQLRRTTLDELLTFVNTLDFGTQEIAAYRRILEATGYSKRKIADRMTAATALVHGLPLVTLNGRDFRDVPGLELIEWERPED
jgi:predicted nucleic acid-binding protein